jgi:hypothetical protein
MELNYTHLNIDFMENLNLSVILMLLIFKFIVWLIVLISINKINLNKKIVKKENKEKMKKT